MGQEQEALCLSVGVTSGGEGLGAVSARGAVRKSLASSYCRSGFKTPGYTPITETNCSI